MSLRDLKAKYGASKTRNAVNRAIRAEIPGGAELLDALTYDHRLDDETRRELLARRDALGDEIARRYGFGGEGRSSTDAAAREDLPAPALSSRQRAIYLAILEHCAATGVPPTWPEIAEALGPQAPRTAHRSLDDLAAKGFLVPKRPGPGHRWLFVPLRSYGGYRVQPLVVEREGREK